MLFHLQGCQLDVKAAPQGCTQLVAGHLDSQNVADNLVWVGTKDIANGWSPTDASSYLQWLRIVSVTTICIRWEAREVKPVRKSFAKRVLAPLVVLMLSWFWMTKIAVATRRTHGSNHFKRPSSMDALATCETFFRHATDNQVFNKEIQQVFVKLVTKTSWKHAGK